MGHEFAMKLITVYFMAHEKSCDRSFMGHESGWWCGLRTVGLGVKMVEVMIWPQIQISSNIFSGTLTLISFSRGILFTFCLHPE